MQCVMSVWGVCACVHIMPTKKRSILRNTPMNHNEWIFLESFKIFCLKFKFKLTLRTLSAFNYGLLLGVRVLAIIIRRLLYAFSFFFIFFLFFNFSNG